MISKVFADDALVTTSNGPIRGEYYESNITSYYQFLGIPYAKPPVDDLRFEVCMNDYYIMEFWKKNNFRPHKL